MNARVKVTYALHPRYICLFRCSVALSVTLRKLSSCQTANS